MKSKDSKTLEKYSWYKAHKLVEEIKDLPIECILASELCFGISYSNVAYYCYYFIKDVFSFENWNEIVKELCHLMNGGKTSKLKKTLFLAMLRGYDNAKNVIILGPKSNKI